MSSERRLKKLQGYKDSERELMRRNRMIRINLILAVTHVLLIVLNIIFAVNRLSIFAVFSAVVYLTLFTVYGQNTKNLLEIGFEKAKYFNIFKYISLILFILTCAVALLSMN